MDTGLENFHENYLKPWNCLSCPVCHIMKNPNLVQNYVCMKCGTRDTLWFCLFCGHVGCGHRVRKHALHHFRKTNHRCVMGLQEFQVWDYKIKKWSHCLVPGEKLYIFPTTVTTPEYNSCSCPLCQYQRTPRLVKQTTCMKCEINDVQNLWMCLSCFHIGCSRFKNYHALEHYKATYHPRVMQLSTLFAWDYIKEEYVCNQPHKIEHDKSRNDDVGSHDIKNEIAVATTNESNTSNIRIEILRSSADFSPSCFPKTEFPTTTELSQQQDNISNRLDRLERQWEEISKLKEANHKMITIEKRLLNLTEEKKILEEKVFEHDAKLNELLTQMAGNRKNSLQIKTLKTGEFEINREVSRTTKTSVLHINLGSPVRTVSSNNFDENKFIMIIISGLFVFCMIKLAVQKMCEMLAHLF